MLWIDLIKDNLTDDLRLPKYRGHPNKFRGHCYVASEAYYHLTGKYLDPAYIKLSNGETHWVLLCGDVVLDLTDEQFDEDFPDYTKVVRCGFLTKEPSKRARILMDRVLLADKERHNKREL